jgi:peptidoglycan/xylan/chitin deacetylase (PgdA/CDA1 family)
MYHRVLPGEEAAQSPAHGGITVEADTFEKQIQYLCKHFKPISLPRFIEHLGKKIPFATKTCLITFDDGWKDNLVNAYPILKKYRVPALIFLPTDFIGSSRSFWQEELADLLVKARKQNQEDKEFSLRNRGLFDVSGFQPIMKSDEARLPEEIAAFLSAQKKKSILEIEKLLQVMKQALPDQAIQDRKESVFLNWDEVKAMASDGIDFGSHGKSHALLPNLEPAEAEREIGESKEILEHRIGQCIDAFSYPNGDCNERLAEAVRGHGYRVAFGTEQGTVIPGADPFRICRVNIHQDMTETIPLFLARISGIC